MVSNEIADIIRKTAEKIRRREEEKRRWEEEKQRRQEEYLQQCLMEQQMQEMRQGSTLFFDTETTGTPRNYNAPVSDSPIGLD